MKKIDLNVPLLDLEGLQVEGMNLGKLLALELVHSINKEDPIKLYDLALRLNRGEVIELDRSDTEKIRQFVLNSDNITVLGKAQLLNLL